MSPRSAGAKEKQPVGEASRDIDMLPEIFSLFGTTIFCIIAAYTFQRRSDEDGFEKRKSYK
jgi:hypothetical protein